MTTETVVNLFEQMGGKFTSSPILLSEKLKNVKALVFDWDGVWHDGRKDGSGKSSFSEIDSMGLNLLRFGMYLQHGELPLTFIITGENNTTAIDFANREHLDGVFYKAKNKREFFDFLLSTWQLEPYEVLFAFDDVLDLSMAERCGARFFVSRSGSPLLSDFVTGNGLADYTTANDGGNHAVRELCELCLGLMGSYADVVAGRMTFSEQYSTYWDTRNTKVVRYFTKTENGITETF